MSTSEGEKNMRKGSGRIRALLGAVVVVALLAGAQTSSGQTPGKRITLLIWSSTWNGVMKQLAEQFTKETGIGVDIEIQASSMEGLAKLQAMRGRPTVDVWFTAAGVAQLAGTNQGLLAPMPVDQMSNWRDLIPGATTPTFAAAYYFPFGIVYRPDLVPNGKITSWEELWGPGFANKLAVPTPPVFQGRMLLVAALLNGGNVDNIDPGIAKLQQLKKNVAFWFSSDPQARKALAQGEVSVMVTSSSTIKTLADQGVRVEMVSPKPAPILFEGMTILKTGKEQMAAQFVNYLLGPEAQAVITQVWNMGPVNKKISPAGKFASILPKPGDQVTFDDAVVNERLGRWTDLFNANVAK
jgi:putative spermidine/putrescine transport system substrate-binding protein